MAISIKVDQNLKFGQFANAFRVIEELGQDCFLDFMVYSADAEEATVVARVRVRRDFLAAIQEKVGEARIFFTVEDLPEAEESGIRESPMPPRKDGETVH